MIMSKNEQILERLKELNGNEYMAGWEAAIFLRMRYSKFKEIVEQNGVPFFPSGKRSRHFRKSVIVNLRKELEVTA